MTVKYTITALMPNTDFVAVLRGPGDQLATCRIDALAAVTIQGPLGVRPDLFAMRLHGGRFKPVNLRPDFVGISRAGRPLTDALPKDEHATQNSSQSSPQQKARRAAERHWREAED